MAEINIQIKGLQRLQKAFSKAPQVITNHLNDGISRSMYILERTAKKESPVDTGRLRSSHRVEQNRTSLRGELFPTVNYAVFVHERGVTRRWAGNPWLERTARQEQRVVENTIQGAIDRALNNIF